MKKAVLQIIAEKIEDYNESVEEFDMDSIYVGINNEHLNELESDPLSSIFCIKYVDEDFENLGVYCNFTGVDVIVDDKHSEIEVVSKI